MTNKKGNQKFWRMKDNVFSRKSCDFLGKSKIFPGKRWKLPTHGAEWIQEEMIYCRFGAQIISYISTRPLMFFDKPTSISKTIICSKFHFSLNYSFQLLHVPPSIQVLLSKNSIRHSDLYSAHAESHI